jgi:hypothetical protein
MTARDDNLRLLNSPDGRAGLRSLTAVERALFGGLIARQFAYRPHLRGELSNYGVRGVVQLYSAIAMTMYMVPLYPPVLVFAALSVYVVAIPLFVLAVLLLMAMLARSTTAAMTGRRWRRSIARRRGDDE